VRVLTLRLRAVLAARALCLRVGGRPGQLVVLDEEIGAVAIAAGGGRILASRAHLAALPVVDRRALLAHEGAHLRHHHHRYRLAAELAAAVDPLQHRVSGAVRYAIERWADEAAAAAVGSRAVVARSLARSALRPVPDVPPSAWEPLALRSAGGRSVARVQAMLAPAPRRRPTLVLAAAALVACALAAALHAQQDTETFFDQAAVRPAAQEPGGSAARGTGRAGSAQLGGHQRHEGQVRLVLREHAEGPLVGEQRQ
jgi:hypothetical protein